MSEKLKKFDLNIEEILDSWQPHDAVREIISNALDEQMLTETDSVDIIKDLRNRWHIRDYGRGIQYRHFTMKENKVELFEGTYLINDW